MEHVTFNAALLSAVLCAYPDAQVEFAGERSHVAGVRDVVTRFGPPHGKRVSWTTLDIPKRDRTGWLRLMQELGQVSGVLSRARASDAGLVVFASVTNTGVVALKARTARWPVTVPVVCVMHGMINRIVGRWPIKPWNWPLNLRAVLRLPQPKALWYLLLGPSLVRVLERLQPRLAAHFVSVDIPNLAYDQDVGAAPAPTAPVPIRFGHLGVGNITKGFGSFARLAATIAPTHPNAEFTLVGHLGAFRDDTDFSSVVGVSSSMLPVDEYKRRAASLTYVVSLANPVDYRLAASSSFIEALFYGKPGVYLRNEYIDYAFAAMGDIGYVCDSYEEVVDTVRALAESFPVERYRQQVATIRAGREMFQPESVGRQLRELVMRLREDAA